EIVREWPMPTGMTGTAEQLELWAQVKTGMVLEADGGVRILDALEWQDRRRKLIGTELLDSGAADH
ncbi:MAG TPA: hypothetical protein VKD90_19790, partial [Gemmataceae bacterium]|nr:hypothetical protein [Gemmataceae bacterium]